MVTPIGSSINMLKRILSKIAAAACILWLCSACSGAAVEVSTNTDTFIYPDYAGVTIPINIAPLNFHYTAPGIKKAATTVTFNDDVVEFSGKEVVWDMQQWKSLVASAVSDTIRFSSELVLKGGVKQTYDWEITDLSSLAMRCGMRSKYVKDALRILKTGLCPTGRIQTTHA